MYKIIVSTILLYLAMITVGMRCLDDLFANANCPYKIFTEYSQCNERKEEYTLSHSSNFHSYTEEKRRIALNKIECCAYWQFLDCVQSAAHSKCGDDAKNIEKDIEYLRSDYEVKLYVCREEYPKGSFKCKFPLWAIAAITLSVIAVLVLAIFVFICFRSKVDVGLTDNKLNQTAKIL